METEFLRSHWETLDGERLKTAAETTLHGLGSNRLGQQLLEWASGGERIADTRLNTEVAGLFFENPVMVGAGWDKKGRCIDGLYQLGFAGTEIGSVLAFPQAGNPRPRLWTDKDTHSIGLNRLGFNSPGVNVVENYLRTQERKGVVGLSLGKNKLLPDAYAPWAHAEVARQLYGYVDYFVINVSSPNTPGLRDQLKPQPLTEIIRAVRNSLRELGGKPLFVKTTVDLSIQDLDKVLEVLINEGVDGIIDSNTTVDDRLKANYGWAGQPGGLSGNDPEYRKRANDRMKYITRTTRQTGLHRIGVGGINTFEAGLQRVAAGAQVFQVVTGIRQYKGKTARNINMGLVDFMDRWGVKSIEDIVGITA